MGCRDIEVAESVILWSIVLMGTYSETKMVSIDICVAETVFTSRLQSPWLHA